MSFLFVDRITELERGKRAVGEYRMPSGLRQLPAWLVAEAIGQLASWVGIEKSDFRCRPVAALAGEVAATHATVSGEAAELRVDVDRCDAQTIVYRGQAYVGGTLVGELRRCAGAMLAIEEFDDPEVVRERYRLLRGEGAPGGDFIDELPSLSLSEEGRVLGKRLLGELNVPRTAPFFADHFPRKPVFPATLLIEAEVRVALALAREVVATPALPLLRLVRVRNVKVRAFTSPGQTLHLRAELRSASAETAEVDVSAWSGERRVATSRVELSAGKGD
jgi:3-hydroxymyristoyl/3-hydroxydecanoyl-(acyl carrier protein) dehydratase